MRPLVAVFSVCLSILLLSQAQGQEPGFPYRARVATGDAVARSGPGENYYPTDQLQRGQEVEVYRHDPGGWCAIRPVETSFAWISGQFLEPTEGNLAVVTEEGVAAAVGSRMSGVRNVIQVRLHKGEVVEVLEGPRLDSGASQWCKIAPPSGEFRWVAARHIAAQISNSTAPSEPTEQQPGSKAQPSAAKALRPDEFQAELNQIELELGVILVDPATTWSFGSLKERTNVLLDSAQTAVERGRARLLADKIARFDNIRQRREALAVSHGQMERAERIYARTRSGEQLRATRLEAGGRYDGVGQLTKIATPRPGAPRFALTDASGSVRCYVTPAPGVHLQNYLGRDVGVIGTRGYMPEQQANHVMVRHVTPLAGQTYLR